MTNTPVALCEALFDTTLVASDLIRAELLYVEDSRDLFRTCLALAIEFEADYASEVDYDYLSRIEDFAREGLLAEYGEED